MSQKLMFVKKFNYGQNRSIKGVHKLMGQKTKESFFTKDKTFYRTLFPLLITVALQNIVAYSVNMADNIMLGSYSQNALSGAATVNQIFFMVQQITLGIGEGFVVAGGPILGAAAYAADPETDRYCVKTGTDLWNYYHFDLYLSAASGGIYFYQ